MNGKKNSSLFYDLIGKMSKVAEYAEIYIEKSEYNSIVFENNQLDRLERISDSGIGFRIVKGEKTYYAFTNNFDIKKIIECVDNLCQFAEHAAEEKVFDFTVKKYDGDYKNLPEDVPLKNRIDFVKDVDKYGWDSDYAVQVTTTYKDTLKRIRIINSDGDDLSQELSYITLFSNVVCERDGDYQTGFESVGGLYGYDEFLEENPLKVASVALKRALINLDADYAPAGIMTVVLSSKAGGTMVHEAVGHGLEADLAANGLSVYQNKIGHKVASDKITVIDDATIKGKRGSFFFDDEGIKAEKTFLIENGVLKNYMYDRLYAMKEGKKSTGNGRRQSYRFKPIVRMTNTYIAPGSDSPETILKSVEKGLYVVKMGGGQVNTVSGDFVFEVTEGYMIEKGEIAKPVKNATLIGNGPKIMEQIDMVGNDLGFAIGTCGKDGQGVPVSDAQPTIRIPEITVGGK